MTLTKIIAWYTLKGTSVDHHSYTNTNVQGRQSTMWYFQATVGNRTITLNYRKYGNRYVMHNEAYVEYDASTDNSRIVWCGNVTKLKEELKCQTKHFQ